MGMLVLTETCIAADILDSDIHFEGYNVFRADRQVEVVEWPFLLKHLLFTEIHCGWRSAVVVTGLLAATDPFSPFFCLLVSPVFSLG
jgi:hypothetical protein